MTADDRGFLRLNLDTNNLSVQATFEDGDDELKVTCDDGDDDDDDGVGDDDDDGDDGDGGDGGGNVMVRRRARQYGVVQRVDVRRKKGHVP